MSSLPDPVRIQISVSRFFACFCSCLQFVAFLFISSPFSPCADVPIPGSPAAQTHA